MAFSGKLVLTAASIWAMTACAPVSQAPEANAPALAEGSEPYSAIGTEPFWALQITDNAIRFEPMEGPAAVATEFTARPSFNGWRYSSDTISVDVTFTPCNDGMSDTVYKDTVTVLVGTTEFRGCGGGEVLAGAKLSNTKWQIISVNGADVYNPMGRGPLLVRFGHTELSAATGCNGIGGSYLAGETWLYAPMLMATEMACEPRLMEQERTIATALSNHSPLRAGPEGNMLLGYDGAQLVLANGRPCPECETDLDQAIMTPILKGRYHVAQINGQIVQSDSPYELNFDQGQMTGFAGCNRFFASFSQEERLLSFGPIGATKMACMGQSGMDERVVMDILEVPSTVMITDTTVVLANAAGGLVLQHTAVE